MPSIEILNGKNAGTVVDLDELAGKGPITLGNRRTATVVLRDPWISFMHAVLEASGAGFTVADKRSKAGTFVNGTPVGNRAHALSDGDTITVLRNGQPVAFPVTAGEIQGEWTVVRAPELQAGDRVQGSLASYVNESSGRQFGGPGNGGPPPGVGGGSGRP